MRQPILEAQRECAVAPDSNELKKAFKVIQRLESQLEALERARIEPIAIVGMACRFPGADGLEAFWSLLTEGREAITEVPAERWDIDALYDPDPDASGKMSTRCGGFIPGVDLFDPAFFNIAPREAALMDPQQRLLLELSWAALEHAAIAPDSLEGSPTGVFVGICSSDYPQMAAADAENLNAYWGTGNAPSVAAGRIAYTFGLQGPCVSIDTACSSALVAVHSAIESLRRGESDTALAAGVNLLLAPQASIAFSKARMLSPDGRCRTFDERANGYVRSEGAAVIVLKTLSRARADGDRVHAVIRGSAINQDGASGGLTVPNGPSQTGLIRQALTNAGVRPEEIAYVEAHGTGTALGDPIEVADLGEVFGRSHHRDRPLYIGSVKTLVGHLEVAAGMAGLIKLVLALDRGVIPGYPHLGKLNSHIPWERLPFAVAREPVPWPATRRIGGVSSFGFSGTNAHLVVEAALPPQKTDETKAATPAKTDITQPLHLLCLSARSDAALLELARRYADHLSHTPGLATDSVCHVAATGRAHLSHRLALAAPSNTELAGNLARTQLGIRGVSPARPPRLAFLFSGQGAQYTAMGRRLYELHPVFRNAINRCDEILGSELDRSLRDLLWGAGTDLLSETRYTQPALFAFEYALANLWQSWGVSPNFVIGHSVGEYSAACMAGIFSVEDGLRLTAARGRLMQALPPGGAMAALSAPRDLVATAIGAMTDRVSIAAINSPTQTVISGVREALLDVCTRISTDHSITDCRLLDVSHAFHSPLMRPMLDAFRKVVQSVSFSRPSLGFVSTLTGRLADAEVCTTDYWVDHVLAPVDFMAGIAALASHDVGVALEIGPGTTLTGLARASLADNRMRTLASLHRRGDEWQEILTALGELYVAGVTIDWRRAGRLDQPPPARVTLPGYPFERHRHWLPKATHGAVLPRPTSGGRQDHPLLGGLFPTAALSTGDALYQSMLAPRRPDFLRDHRVYDRIVVPGAAYVEMALTAAASRYPNVSPGLVNLSIQMALVLTADRAAVVQTLVTQGVRSERPSLRILSHPAHDEAAGLDVNWQLHVSGEIESTPAEPMAPVDLVGLRRRFIEIGDPLDVADFYGRYAALGLNYGPAFRSVRSLARIGAGGESLAHVTIETNAAAGYWIHPTLLDGCFQAVGAIFKSLGRGDAYLPIAIQRLRVLGPIPDEIWSHAVLRENANAADPGVMADIRLIDGDGQVVMLIEGLRAVPIDRQALTFATADWKDKLYTVNWVLQPRRPTATDGRAHTSRLTPGGGWLVLADEGSIAGELADALETRNQVVCRVRADETDGMNKATWQRLISERFNAHHLPLVGIVHLWAVDARDTDDPAAFADAQARICGSTLALVQALMDLSEQRLPRLWLITSGAQPVDQPTHTIQAMLWGFARTIALEHPALECTCIDLPPNETGLPSGLIEDIVAPEAEPQIAYRQDRRYVARLLRARSQGRRDLALPEGAFRLRAAEYGAFDQLALVGFKRIAPADDQIEIEVRAAAVNFKDVLFCLGMLREFSERAGITVPSDQPLGFECAGRVTSVGAKVTDLAPGDEVFAMAPSAMASHVIVDRRLVHRKPARLSFEMAAALPTVFMTAIHSLKRLARIRPGDHVLVHACAGGVGQAALQVARRAGAVVYGTASPGKWRVLKAQGVAHVMHSRNLDFADELMRVTAGRGVDIVINSLSGAFIEKSADVLAPGGRFVEIGKIGIWNAERMAAYRPDISYSAFDLGEIDATGGGLQAELLDDVSRRLEAGELEPLPVRVFPVTRAEAAFRHLAQAKNIGKVVLGVPASNEASVSPVSPDRSYLVTGGLGALGRQIARRLVAEGARHIVLASRSPDTATAPALTDMVDGASIHVWSMDVADPLSVAAVIARIGRELPPLGGIFHAAGVLDDATILKQSWSQFQRVLAPKVAGAWNLHRATEGMNLSHFVLFSSIASITGSPGQANYAAANAYLDALANLRRAQGLPATCINWGPWDTDGMAERTRHAHQARFNNFGLGRLSVADNLDVLSYLIGAELPATAVVDITWTRFLSNLPSPAAAVLYSRIDGAAATARSVEAGVLLKQLEATAPADRIPLLAEALRSQVATVIGLDSPDLIGFDQPLLKLGIDSLMAVELKNRVESGLRCTLKTTLLLDHPTLNRLAAYLVTTVLGPGSTAPAAAVTADSDPAVATESCSTESAPERTAFSIAARTRLALMTESAIEMGSRRIALCRWGPTSPTTPLVVCVHGILDQAAIWDGLADGLARAGIAVLAPDLRGHGASSHPPASSNITVLDFVIDLIDVIQRETAGRLVLVGHSMGSVVAALYTALYPDNVAHLVMVEPVMPAMRAAHNPLERLSNDLRYLTDAPAHPIYPDIGTAARMLMPNHPKLSEQQGLALARRVTRAVEGGVSWIWDPRLRNRLGTDLMLSQQDYLTVLDALTVPSTRLYGTTSEFAGTSVLLAPDRLMPRSQSVAIDGGHNLHTDATADLLDQVLVALGTATEGSLPC
jgi:acyl transferase domain-containing protein/NAD(P)-dependent dehydrogenase (short-subunit alcohol dehydrogenase family)/dienelactone hydrolase